jgi:hypothetical protein
MISSIGPTTIAPWRPRSRAGMPSLGAQLRAGFESWARRAGPPISWLTTGHRQGRGTDSLAKPREFRRSTSYLHGCGRLRSPWAR